MSNLNDGLLAGISVIQCGVFKRIKKRITESVGKVDEIMKVAIITCIHGSLNCATLSQVFGELCNHTITLSWYLAGVRHKYDSPVSGIS